MMYKELFVGDKSYKCRLSASKAIALEDKLGYNPITKLTSGDMPSLKEMMNLFHAMLQEYQHGIKFEDACKIYDEYCEDEGNDQTSFFWFLLKAAQVNGYVSKDVDFDALEKASEEEVKKLRDEVDPKN